jgi:hypothetical protein
MPPERRDETIVAQQAQNLASAVRLSRLGERTPAYELVGEDAGPEFEQFESESLDSAVRSPAMHDDFSGDLERLSDEALLAALQQADEQLVHRALAASSEKFLKRVIGKLSRRQARSVRKQLRAMGPTRLADLRQAQFDLLQLTRGRAAATAA